MKIEKACQNCSKMFTRYVSNQSEPKFCSYSCRSKFTKKRENLSRETRKKMSIASSRPSKHKGMKWNEEQKRNLKDSLENSEAMKEYSSLSYIDKMKRAHGELWEEKIKERKMKQKGQFTLEWYIKKYGESEGILKYKDRSNKLKLQSYWHKYNSQNKMNFSKISQILFWNIYTTIKDIYSEIYFGELNHEYSAHTGKYNYDFVLNDKKKIIEFNGEKFHPKENQVDWKNPFGVTYEEQIKIDTDKKIAAEKQGYEIMYVWGKEMEDIEIATQKCIEFLLQN